MGIYGEGSFKMCHCGHYEMMHVHYRPGSDCGLCSCDEFVTPDERLRRLRRGFFIVLPLCTLAWGMIALAIVELWRSLGA